MSEALPPPTDTAARERAVTHPGSVLVQAPAGSGKTTLLVQRFLRVLATVDAPESILALTFTRRAALEMRERISRALETARSAAGAANLDPVTRRLAVDALRHLDALGIDLGVHGSRLRIETIDAFNAWLAAQLPIGSGLGASPRIAQDAADLYREAARRALAYEDEDAFGAAVERVLALGDQRHEALVDLIGGMLRSRERWLPLLAGGLRAAARDEEAALPAVRRRFDEDLALLIGRVLHNAAALLGGQRIAAVAPLLCAAAARAAGRNAALECWRGQAAPLRADPADLARWRGFAAIALTAKGTVRTRLTVAEGFAPGVAQKRPMQDLLEEMGRDPRALRVLSQVAALPPAAYGDEDWERVRDVARVLVLGAAELERVFRERGAADFPAVSIAALRALGDAELPSDLALRLDYRLRHVLVDEFQDTSGAQLDLLRMLTAGWQPDDGRSVFCVGDPMQSIYGFRQAEVRAFLQLADEGLGGLPFEVLRLTDNFRAIPPLVGWVNATFARILPACDDRDRGAIAFRRSRAVRAQGDDAGPAVRTVHFASRAAEAAAAAELIATRRAQQPSWRIALLVRARSHAREIAARLRERGVEFRAIDIEPLADRPAVRDLVMLARALLHLGDRTAWFALLRAPWAGVRLADLLTLGRAAPTVWQALEDEAVLAALTADGRRRCERLREVLREALAARNRGGLLRWLECSWLALGGPCCATSAADLEDARAAFARLRELERRGLPDPADLAGEFANLFARDAGQSHVELMTIHKAKGLEFDLVVVPGLDRAIARRNEEFLLSLQFSRMGRDGMIMAARPAIGADSDPLFEFLRGQAREGADLEAERLLYVACTRARNELCLSAVIGNPAEAPDGTVGRRPGAAAPRAGSLLAVLWPVVGDEFTPATAAGTDADAAADADADALVPHGGLRRVPDGWTTPRIAVPGTEPPAGGAPPRVPSPPFDWVGETARQIGTLVHAELQRFELPGFDAAALREREPSLRRWLAAHGVPPQWLDAASGRVVAALAAVQQDPRGRWILAGDRRDDMRERAWSGVCNGEVVHAVFDRSFVDEEGVRWVIDYKTSEHLGGGEQTFLDREVERYRPQMDRYAVLARRLGAEPVRLGLYFPLMRAWREWPAP